MIVSQTDVERILHAIERAAEDERAIDTSLHAAHELLAPAYIRDVAHLV